MTLYFNSPEGCCENNLNDWRHCGCLLICPKPSKVTPALKWKLNRIRGFFVLGSKLWNASGFFRKSLLGSHNREETLPKDKTPFHRPCATGPAAHQSVTSKVHGSTNSNQDTKFRGLAFRDWKWSNRYLCMVCKVTLNHFAGRTLGDD